METTSIYQALWSLDLQHNGCTVTSRNKNGNWILPDADIKLDEQTEATRGSADNAPNPLFADVNQAKLGSLTYQKLIASSDTYVVNVRESEDHRETMTWKLAKLSISSMARSYTEAVLVCT